MSSSLTVRGLDARAVQSFYDIGLVQNYCDGKILHVGHSSLLSQRVSSVLPNTLSLLEACCNPGDPERCEAIQRACDRRTTGADDAIASFDAALTDIRLAPNVYRSRPGSSCSRISRSDSCIEQANHARVVFCRIQKYVARGIHFP